MAFRKKILAIIPARGGSKGFPSKNIYPLNGKPLITYTIDASLRSKMVAKTVVSSDDDEILKIAESSGAAIIKRPAELALDTSSSEEAVKHAIEFLKENGEHYDAVVLLQPTSPLRTAEDIDKAIELMIIKNASAVISVVNIGKKPFKSYYQNKEGFLLGVHNDQTPNMRRQDLPDAFLANGAIYAVYTETFLKTNSFLPADTIPYIMPEEKSIDIDRLEDVRMIENIIAY